MNRKTMIVIAAVLVFMIISPVSRAQRVHFPNPEDTKQQIEKYFRDILKKTVLHVHLLEIIRSGSECQTMVVYFLKDKHPHFYKDENNLIDSEKAPVFVAKYQFSYLTYSWRISELKELTEKRIFVYDDAVETPPVFVK